MGSDEHVHTSISDKEKENSTSPDKRRKENDTMLSPPAKMAKIDDW